MPTIQEILQEQSSKPEDAIGLLEGEGYFSPTRSRAQARNHRRVRSDIRNTERSLIRQGFGEEVQEVNEELEQKGTTARLFDGLQAANFAIAGGVRELQGGGTSFDALRRAASEFTASSDIFDFYTDEEIGGFFGKAPKRESFAEVLREASDRGEGDVPTAAAGLILDIVLDPTTYASFGAGALGKIGKAAPLFSVFSAANKVGSTALATSRGKDLVKTIFKEREGLIKNIPNTLGKLFKPKFDWEQAIREADPDQVESLGMMMSQVAGRDIEQHLGTETLSEGLKEIVEKNPDAFQNKGGILEGAGIVEGFKNKLDHGVNIKDFIVSLSADMTQMERRMVGLFFDQPDELLEVIRHAAPDRAAFIEQKLDVWQDFMGVLAREEEAVGLHSVTELRNFYDSGLTEGTASSRKLMNQIRENLEITKRDRASIDVVAPGSHLDPTATKQLQEKFASLEERILAGIPTELDIANIGVARGFHATRRVANKRLYDSVFSNPEIVKRTKDNGDIIRIWNMDEKDVKRLYGSSADDMLQKRKALKAQLNEKGYDLYTPVGKVLPGAKGEAGLIKEGKRFIDPKTGEEVLRVSGGAKAEQSIVTIDGVAGHLKDPHTPARLVENGKIAEDAVPLHTLRKGDKFTIDTPDGSIAGELTSSGAVGTVIGRGSKGDLPYSASTTVRELDEAPSFIIPKVMKKELDMVNAAFNGGKETRDILKMYDKVQSMWKGYAVASPGFISRALQSNVFANWLGGVPPNPKNYADVMKLQAGKKAGMTVKVGDKVYTDGEIIRLADNYGIRGSSGYQRDLGLIDEDAELLNSLAIRAGKTGEPTRKALGTFHNPIVDAIASADDGRTLMRTMSETFGSGGKILQKNREIGSAMENNSKLVHFIYKLRKGMSPEDAANSVKRYLFDYGELTEFEQKFMRRTIPFYTWVRKNVPLMYSELLKNPGKFSMVPKGMDFVEDLSDDVNHHPVPDYFQEVSAIRMPKFVDRGVRDTNVFMAKALYSMGIVKEKPSEVTGLQPVFLKPDLPFQDLDIGAKDLLSGLTPLLRIPIETQVGQSKGFSFFLDRPIENFEGQPAEVTPIPFLPFKMRKKHQSALEGAIPWLGKVNRIRTRAHRGQGASQLATELLGFKGIQNDIELAKGMKGKRKQRKIRDLQKRLKEEGKLRSR